MYLRKPKFFPGGPLPKHPPELPVHSLFTTPTRCDPKLHCKYLEYSKEETFNFLSEWSWIIQMLFMLYYLGDTLGNLQMVTSSLSDMVVKIYKTISHDLLLSQNL